MKAGFIIRMLATFLATVIGLGLHRIFSKSRKKFKAIADSVGGKLIVSLTGSEIRVVKNGHNVKIRITPEGQNTPPSFSLHVAFPFHTKFRVYKRARFNKVLSLFQKEVKTYDMEFDNDFIIMAEKPEYILTLFQDYKVKEAVRFFFDNGFRKIFHTGKEIVFRKEGYTSRDIAPDMLNSYIERAFVFMRSYFS